MSPFGWCIHTKWIVKNQSVKNGRLFGNLSLDITIRYERPDIYKPQGYAHSNEWLFKVDTQVETPRMHSPVFQTTNPALTLNSLAGTTKHS